MSAGSPPWLAANQAAAKRCCRLAISTNLASCFSSRLRLPSSVMLFSPEESDRWGVLSLPVLLGVPAWTCRFRCLGVPGVMLAARMDAAALDAFMLLVDSEESAPSAPEPLPFFFQRARRVDLAGLGRGLGRKTRSRL